MNKTKLKTKDLKLLMYMAYHYGYGYASEKDLNDAMEKDGWFKMSLKEIKKRYGKQIDENIKKGMGQE